MWAFYLGDTYTQKTLHLFPHTSFVTSTIFCTTEIYYNREEERGGTILSTTNNRHVYKHREIKHFAHLKVKILTNILISKNLHRQFTEQRFLYQKLQKIIIPKHILHVKEENLWFPYPNYRQDWWFAIMFVSSWSWMGLSRCYLW